jgi:ferric-chelate reductase
MKGAHAMFCRDALYVWIFIAFWLFDRVARGIRLIVINRGKPESHEAIVETVGRDSVRLVLPNRHISWRPGQHMFLIVKGASNLPFEHPFTIANIPERDEKGCQKPADLVFYIRARHGLTRKLHNYAALDQRKTIAALVEGPYGQPPPVNSFSTVVLIAGEHTFFELLFQSNEIQGDLVSLSRFRFFWISSRELFVSTLLSTLNLCSAARRQKTAVKRVTFVWSVKDGGKLGLR